MNGEAQVYLKSNDLPITIKGAAQVRYFPDGSVHVLDPYERPVFIGAPGMYVAVIMEYPEPPKSAPLVEQHNEKQYQPRHFPSAPSAKVHDHKPERMEPGTQRVTPLRERQDLPGVETQEMQVVDSDFLPSPRRAGKSRGKTPSHSGSSGLRGTTEAVGDDTGESARGAD